MGLTPEQRKMLGYVNEGDQRQCACYSCHKETDCTYLKTAHVPLYAWVCEDCREEWVSE